MVLNLSAHQTPRQALRPPKAQTAPQHKSVKWSEAGCKASVRLLSSLVSPLYNQVQSEDR